MTREEMVDRIIRKYGFESQITICFATLAENKDISEEFLLRWMGELL